MYTDYKQGDEVWIFISGHKGNKSKGKILEVLDLSKHGYGNTPYYLIEVPTSVDELLEVRDAFMMSSSEDSNIGMWESLKET